MGLQDSVHFEQSFLTNIAVEVLKDLGHDHRIELAVFKRHGLAVSNPGTVAEGQSFTKSPNRAVAWIERPDLDPFFQGKSLQRTRADTDVERTLASAEVPDQIFEPGAGTGKRADSFVLEMVPDDVLSHGWPSTGRGR